jgi:hypothetical protein
VFFGEPRLRADFNSPRSKDRVVALLGFGGSTEPPRRGQVVRLFDGDENSCLGVVDRVDNDLVYVAPDWTTWSVRVTLDGDLLAALRRTTHSFAEDVAETRGLDPERFDIVRVA